MVTTIQGLGGNTMPWLFTSTIERIFYTIQTHLSRGEIFFKSLESCQKVFCPNGTNLSKAHRTSVTPIKSKRRYTVVEKFKNETISILNDLLFLIIQCVISALLIFRASDIFLPDRSACSWPEAISYAPPTVSRNSLTAFHIFQPWSFLKLGVCKRFMFQLVTG